MSPIGSGYSYGLVKEMDTTKSVYSEWAPKNTTAAPYDSTLKGNYPYITYGNTVHHGDWPDVEKLAVNQ